MSAKTRSAAERRTSEKTGLNAFLGLFLAFVFSLATGGLLTYLVTLLSYGAAFAWPLVGILPGIASMYLLRDWRGWWRWAFTLVATYLFITPLLAFVIGSTWSLFHLWFVQNRVTPWALIRQRRAYRSGNAPTGLKAHRTQRSHPKPEPSLRENFVRMGALLSYAVVTFLSFLLASLSPLTSGSSLLVWVLLALLPGLATAVLLRDARPVLWWSLIVAFAFGNVFSPVWVYLVCGTAALFQSWYREHHTTPWAAWKNQGGFSRIPAPKSPEAASLARYAHWESLDGGSKNRLQEKKRAAAKKKADADKAAQAAAADASHGR